MSKTEHACYGDVTAGQVPKSPLGFPPKPSVISKQSKSKLCIHYAKLAPSQVAWALP